VVEGVSRCFVRRVRFCAVSCGFLGGLFGGVRFVS